MMRGLMDDREVCSVTEKGQEEWGLDELLCQRLMNSHGDVKIGWRMKKSGNPPMFIYSLLLLNSVFPSRLPFLEVV